MSSKDPLASSIYMVLRRTLCLSAVVDIFVLHIVVTIVFEPNGDVIRLGGIDLASIMSRSTGHI